MVARARDAACRQRFDDGFSSTACHRFASELWSADSQMAIEVVEEPMSALPKYARVPIVFTVDRVLDVTARVGRAGTFELSERRLDIPYEKDYDTIDGEGPLQWGRRFDLSNWALFSAHVAARMVGGAAVAFDTP